MKKKVYFKVLGATIIALLLGCTSAIAKQSTENIQVSYSNIKMVVNGVPVEPKDANGSKIEPFIYNGTTYLPVRAVGDAFGQQVTWDGNTKTVYIGEAPNATTYLPDVCPPYDEISYYSGKAFEMDGEKYNLGSFYFTSPWTSKPYALFNLNGEYESLDVLVGHTGSYDREKIINIYLDGQLSQSIILEPDTLAKQIHIPLNNALQMKIELEEGYYVGFANAKLSK